MTNENDHLNAFDFKLLLFQPNFRVRYMPVVNSIEIFKDECGQFLCFAYRIESGNILEL